MSELSEVFLNEETVTILSNPGERFKNYKYTKKDKKILRELAKQKAEIASLPVNEKKIKMWESLNDLENTRPMIWINEIPWHEMNVNDELTIKTSSEFTRLIEYRLRRTIYKWKHLPVDMIVESTILCYLEIENTGFGIKEKAYISRTDQNSDILSRLYIQQIKNEDDINKIKTPKIIYYEDDTDKKFYAMKEIFDGVIEVKKVGYPGFWFSPLDELVRLWGAEQLLLDLVLKPELVNRAVERITEAYLLQLEQFENKKLLSSNNGNFRIGSGGLGYTKDLPKKDYGLQDIKAKDLWGNCAAQIFSVVSPEMHTEFALQHEIRLLERFGLNYYGCCEPLDKKIEILKQIPNLRKISMSPWVNLELGAEYIGRDYVFSYKPNPYIFIEDNWDPETVRDRLSKDLRKIKNCNVEILMKDISTVNYKPERLWEWARIASEEVEKIYN